MKKKIYIMQYVCQNCSRGFEQRFDFGEIAQKGECPFCGVSQNQLDESRLWNKVKGRAGEN